MPRGARELPFRAHVRGLEGRRLRQEREVARDVRRLRAAGEIELQPVLPPRDALDLRVIGSRREARADPQVAQRPLRAGGLGEIDLEGFVGCVAGLRRDVREGPLADSALERALRQELELHVRAERLLERDRPVHVEAAAPRHEVNRGLRAPLGNLETSFRAVGKSLSIADHFPVPGEGVARVAAVDPERLDVFLERTQNDFRRTDRAFAGGRFEGKGALRSSAGRRLHLAEALRPEPRGPVGALEPRLLHLEPASVRELDA